MASQNLAQLGGSKASTSGNVNCAGPNTSCTVRDSASKLSNQIGINCGAPGNCVEGGSPADVLAFFMGNNKSLPKRIPIPTNACVPYTSWKLMKEDNRRSDKGVLPCPKDTRELESCPGGTNNMRGNRITVANAGYVIGVDKMKAAIMTGGPIVAIMNTPATFIAFGGLTNGPDGVYSSNGAPNLSKGALHSSHVVVIAGWSKDAWLVLNSWGGIYNPFTFAGVRFNSELNNDKMKKGGFVFLRMNDPVMKIEDKPAYWASLALIGENGAVTMITKDTWDKKKA